jgi:hypothetical protein
VQKKALFGTGKDGKELPPSTRVGGVTLAAVFGRYYKAVVATSKKLRQTIYPTGKSDGIVRRQFRQTLYTSGACDRPIPKGISSAEGDASL